MLFVGSARLPLREVVDDVELDGRLLPSATPFMAAGCSDVCWPGEAVASTTLLPPSILHDDLTPPRWHGSAAVRPKKQTHARCRLPPTAPATAVCPGEPVYGAAPPVPQTDRRHALGRDGAKCSTRVDPNNGKNPEWGEKLVVPLPPFTARLEDVVLRIDVVHNADEGTIPLVRSARLPPHEFLDDVELDRRASRSLRLKHPYGWLDVKVVRVVVS
ncbi:hypothetical protein ZWY2020_046725 [Hordeum vulgare]|nr:hypothetical protein ZWY2020_046725 [Hordeum vulgare]